MSVRGAGIPAERLLVRRVSLIRTQVPAGFHWGLESVLRAPKRGAARAREGLSGLGRESKIALHAHVSNRFADRQTTVHSRRKRRLLALRSSRSGAGSRALEFGAGRCSSRSIRHLGRLVCSFLRGRAPAPREHVPVVPLLASDCPRRLAETGTLNRTNNGAVRLVPPARWRGRRPVESRCNRLSGPPRSKRTSRARATLQDPPQSRNLAAMR